MPRTAPLTRMVMLGLAGALLAQLTKPTPAEQEAAKQIAALPADRASDAIERMERVQITEGLVQALIGLSEGEHDHAERERLARLAIEAAGEGTPGEMEGKAYAALTSALFAQTDYYDALESSSRAIEKLQQAGSPAAKVASALASRAIARMHTGYLDDALEDAQHALDLASQSGDAVLRARILNGLGNIYKDLGDFRHSLEALEKSLKIARERNERLGEAFVLNNISGLYDEQGDTELSIEYGERSLKIKEALGRTTDAISSLTNLGDSYARVGREAEARESLKKALSLAREAGLKGRIGQALKISADIEIDRGRYQAAIPQLEEAYAMFQQSGERINEAAVLADIAEARFELGQYRAAVKSGKEATELARQSNGTVVVEVAALVLGRAYHALGEVPEARQALGESMAATEEVRENLGGAESQRLGYFATHTDSYRELLTMEMEERQIAPAFRLAERAKGRMLLDILRGGRPRLDRVLSTAERGQEMALHGRLAALRAQLAAAAESGELRPSKRFQDLGQRTQKARMELSVFESSLYAAHPELRIARGDAPPVTIREASQLLPDANAALLEYVVTPRRTYLFVILRGSGGPLLRTHVLELTQRTLETEVSRFREQIASRDPGFMEAARKLHGWLVEPAAKDLAAKTRLVIVPDGELWRLPFQALRTQGGRFLAQDAAVSYTPSLSVMRAIRQRRSGSGGQPRALMVLANPSGDAPDSDREAQAIAALYGDSNSRAWHGAAASSDVFRAQAGEFDVIHLAAHGVFDDRSPMASHIILAAPPKGSGEDGWVEAGEVRSMQLKPALVVLSGCETARGHYENGEGAIGLSWAFLAAGARATVASQWRVESESTAALMVAFHRAMRQGAGGAEALRRASMEVLASGQFHHPFYWAGFELLGDW